MLRSFQQNSKQNATAMLRIVQQSTIRNAKEIVRLFAGMESKMRNAKYPSREMQGKMQMTITKGMLRTFGENAWQNAKEC